MAVHLAVLAAYLAAGIAVNWTRATYLVDHVVPTGRDSGLFVWDYWWIAHLVLHPGNPWFTHYLAAPVGAPLGFHVLMPLPAVLMTPVTLAYGPSFSYNLLAVAAPGLMCYAMYRAARLWVPSQTGAIAAGAFFGLSTMMTWNAWYEIQLALGAIFMPLALEASVRLTRRPGWRQAVILGVVLGVALLVDQESTILAWSLAAAALLAWLVRRRPGGSGVPVWIRLRLLALAGVVTAVVASPQIIAMVRQTLAGQASASPGALADDYRNSGAPLGRIFAPSPRVGFFGLKSVASLYYNAGVTSFTFTAYGVVLTAMALLGLVVWWRRRNARRLALLWLFATWLALGTSIIIGNHRYVPLGQVWHGVRLSMIMPYTWMVRISLLSSFREADRITELGLVAAALLAGAGVNWLRYHAAPALIVVFALGILEAGAVGVMPFQATIPTALPALDGPIAADHSRSIVVDVPMGVRSAVPLPDEGAAFNSEAEMQVPADGHPRAIAYVSRLPESTLAAVKRHPFYGDLFEAQDERGVVYAKLRPGQTDQAWLAAARLDARRMNVGWAIVWASTPVILHYLQAVGFHFDHRADGASVYRLAPHS